MSEFNPYSVLKIDRKATPDEIRSAYRSRSKETHPDREEGSQEEFVLVNRAYRILIDTDSRKEFDEKGRLADQEMTKFDHAVGIISGLFDNILDLSIKHGVSLKTVDIIEQLKGAIANSLAEAQGTLSVIEESIAQLKSVKDRVHRDVEGKNIFVAHIETKLATLEENSGNYRMACSLLEMAATEVSNYSNEVDMMNAFQMYGSSATASAPNFGSFGVRFNQT